MKLLNGHSLRRKHSVETMGRECAHTLKDGRSSRLTTLTENYRWEVSSDPLIPNRTPRETLPPSSHSTHSPRVVFVSSPFLLLLSFPFIVSVSFHDSGRLSTLLSPTTPFLPVFTLVVRAYSPNDLSIWFTLVRGLETSETVSRTPFKVIRVNVFLLP